MNVSLLQDQQQIVSVPQRNLDHARLAYLTRDIEGSREAHRQRVPSTPGNEDVSRHFKFERHTNTSSEFLKAFVFGGLDGIATIFAVIAGCAGVRLPPLQVMIIGISNLIADALAMGVGEYTSAMAENEFVDAEKEREIWEVDNCPEEEKREMVEIYRHKYGFSKEDAHGMIDIAFKYRTFFISHMMVEELGLMDADDGPSPMSRGAVMFLSFACFGVIPLIAYLFFGCAAIYFEWEDEAGRGAFLVACVAALGTLFILGLLKARFVNQPQIKCALSMVVNGVVAGGVSFGVGHALQQFNSPPDVQTSLVGRWLFSQ